MLGAQLARACGLALQVAREHDVAGVERVRLIEADASDSSSARAAVASLAADGCRAIVGSELSDVALAAADAAHAAGLLFWELEAIADELTAEARRGIFRFNCDASSFGATPVDFVAELVAPALGRDPRSLRVGIVHEDTAYGRSTAGGMRRRATALALDVRVAQAVAPGADATPAIARCARERVEVLLSSGYSDHAIATHRAVRDMNVPLLAFVGAGAGYNTERFADAAGPDAASVYVTGNAPAAALDEGRLAPAARELLARYRTLAAAAGMPSRDADLELAFQGTLLLLEGVIGQAPDPSLDALDAASRAIDVAEGGTIDGFGVRFDERGQNARARPALMRRVAGELRAVFPAAFASASLAAAEAQGVG